jgi:hypothetical protein
LPRTGSALRFGIRARLRATIDPDVISDDAGHNYISYGTFNGREGALFIYGNDQNSIRLDVVSIWNTRQTEFGKQISPVPANYPTYDHMVIGPVGDTSTSLRIVKRTGNDNLELYTAYTSNDGTR